LANDCGAGYRGCYIGSIFVENTCFGRLAERKKTKIFAAGAGGEGIVADGDGRRRGERWRSGGGGPGWLVGTE